MEKSNRCHKTSRELEGAESSIAGRLDVDVGCAGVGSSGSRRGDGVHSHAGHGGWHYCGHHGRAASAVSNIELGGLGEDAAWVGRRADAHQIDLVVLADRESSAGSPEDGSAIGGPGVGCELLVVAAIRIDHDRPEGGRVGADAGPLESDAVSRTNESASSRSGDRNSKSRRDDGEDEDD